MPVRTEPVEPARPLLSFDERTGQLRARRYEVSVIVGPDAGHRWTVEAASTVGSDPTAELRLTDSTVSRAHLQLMPRPDGLGVQDLSSTNGTYVGNARADELTLQGESEVRVGKTVLRIVPLDVDVPAPAALGSFAGVESKSPAMQKVLGVLEVAAQSSSPILLLGESGVGKEVLARAVHQRSARADKPWVVVDCAAMVAGVMESELFGHVRGAFTDAVADRVGAFVQASGGTLFLDEVGELPLELQPRLLRVLDSRTVRPVGRDTTTRVDVRIVAATHRDLEAEVAAGRFREDLFFRLAVITIHVPPLRERPEDIPLLIQRLVQASGRVGVDGVGPVLERFQKYRWPGNVRELRNVVEASLAGVQVEPDAQRALRRPGTAVDVGLPYKEAKDQLIEDFTSAYLAGLLEACEGNLSEMSRRAGIARHYLRSLLERYNLRPKGEPAASE